MPRKRSRTVTLVMLGATSGLAACSPGNQPVFQQSYASLEECVSDWGDQELCAPRTGVGYSGGGGGGGFTGGYFGPRYTWSDRSNAPVVTRPDGSTTLVEGRSLSPAGSVRAPSVHVGSVSRGGFGGFGHLFSFGG